MVRTFWIPITARFLQTELDKYWVNVGGEKLHVYLGKYAGRAPIVHLKDFEGQKSDNMYALIGKDEDKEADSGAFEFRSVGYGLQDMPTIVAVAEKAGSQWFVVEQGEPSMGKICLECAQMSISCLKTFL